MRTVVVLPDHPYYLWQMIVQAVHLEELGFEDVHYLVYYGDRSSIRARRARDQLCARVHLMEQGNTRWLGRYNRYDPAMKPMMVSRWMQRDRDRETVPFLYLDPDAVLTRVPDQWPEPWHASDTDSYTGPDYIRSKGEGLLDDMCGIVGVDPEVARSMTGIGAQYVIAGTTAEFWRGVALASVEIHDLCINTRQDYWPDDHEYPVQAWCAEMYATQLAALRDGLNPTPSESMKFMWADGDVSGWDDPDVMFYHNAGAVGHEEDGTHFRKSAWQSVSPFGKSIRTDPSSASHRYVQMIHRAGHRYPELTK